MSSSIDIVWSVVHIFLIDALPVIPSFPLSSSSSSFFFLRKSVISQLPVSISRVVLFNESRHGTQSTQHLTRPSRCSRRYAIGSLADSHSLRLLTSTACLITYLASIRVLESQISTSNTSETPLPGDDALRSLEDQLNQQPSFAGLSTAPRCELDSAATTLWNACAQARKVREKNAGELKLLSRGVFILKCCFGISHLLL